MLACLPALTTLSVVAPVTPVAAAESRDELRVAITRLSPTVVQRAGEVTVAGIVRNPERHAWGDVTVHVSTTREPLTTRGPVRAALAAGNAEMGTRVTDPTAVVRLGTLRPGQTRRFSITASTSQLGLTGADGVHVLAVQVEAVNAAKDHVVAGGAATLLPLRASGTARPAPTTVLWPFLLPGKRLANGDYADTSALSALISPGGQLRNLLDLAETTPRRGSDVVLDPSLLTVLEDMSQAPGTSPAAEARRDAAEEFLEDLTRLADRYSCAAVGYDQPDVLAVTSSSSAEELIDIIHRATTGTLDAHNIDDCLRIEWPSPRGVDRTALAVLRRQEMHAVIVTPWAAPDWDPGHGNVLERTSPADAVPLVVNDPLAAGAAGIPTPATLRQTILSEAVLTSLASGQDIGRTSTVVMVDPRFNPGRVTGEPLAAVYDSEVTDPKNFASRVRSYRWPYDGAVPAKAEARPISSRQVTVATDAAQTGRLIDGILLEESDRTRHAQLIARLISRRWRGQASTGVAAGDHAIHELSREIASISVDGPEALTLSSGAGQFPVTVRNRTDYPVRVALEIESSVPGVRFEGPRSVEVTAGESRTVTVNIDLAAETATTVSVRLASATGLPFGAATVFNVRSTRVGAALWIAIGLSVALVAGALLRRFARPGHRPSHPPLDPDDFDD
jgi:hypothetical protein